MAKRYILTLMAANRVGIMAAFSRALEELGGDLLEVSQTVMQGFFTTILAAEFPEQLSPQAVVDHIRSAGSPYGIEVSLKDPEREVLAPPSSAPIERYFLTLTGHDQPGVVRQISARLAQDGIDITDMYARRQSADRSFVMVLELAVPQGVNAARLQADLEQPGEPLGLRAALQHENIFSATNDPRPVRVRLDA